MNQFTQKNKLSPEDQVRIPTFMQQVLNSAYQVHGTDADNGFDKARNDLLKKLRGNLYLGPPKTMKDLNSTIRLIADDIKSFEKSQKTNLALLPNVERQKLLGDYLSHCKKHLMQHYKEYTESVILNTMQKHPGLKKVIPYGISLDSNKVSVFKKDSESPKIDLGATFRDAKRSLRCLDEKGNDVVFDVFVGPEGTEKQAKKVVFGTHAGAGVVGTRTYSDLVREGRISKEEVESGMLIDANDLTTDQFIVCLYQHCSGEKFDIEHNETHKKIFDVLKKNMGSKPGSEKQLSDVLNELNSESGPGAGLFDPKAIQAMCCFNQGSAVREISLFANVMQIKMKTADGKTKILQPSGVKSGETSQSIQRFTDRIDFNSTGNAQRILDLSGREANPECMVDTQFKVSLPSNGSLFEEHYKVNYRGWTGNKNLSIEFDAKAAAEVYSKNMDDILDLMSANLDKISSNPKNRVAALKHSIVQLRNGERNYSILMEIILPDYLEKIEKHYAAPDKKFKKPSGLASFFSFLSPATRKREAIFKNFEKLKATLTGETSKITAIKNMEEGIRALDELLRPQAVAQAKVSPKQTVSQTSPMLGDRLEQAEAVHKVYQNNLRPDSGHLVTDTKLFEATRDAGKTIPSVESVQPAKDVSVESGIARAVSAADSPKDQTDSPKLDSPKDQPDSPKRQLDSPRGQTDSPKVQADSPTGQDDFPKQQADSPKDEATKKSTPLRR